MITFQPFNLQQYTNCLIVTDSKIAALYNITGDNVYLLPRGEKAKSLYHARKLCSWFLAHNLTKSDTVVAVGGGSIGDTVGFAASVYKRGVRLLHVPTTLLAQIDSSIGGKTAVDLDGVKNAIGTFYQADTLIDVDFLSTLDKTQRLNGYGELLKYRMLSSDIDEIYLKHGAMSVQTVRACVEFKQNICNIDPFDKGKRRLLNLGHTIGHAMELYNRIPHGVAVANGIYYETLLASKLGLCSKHYADKWMSQARNNFTIYSLNNEILQLTANDKKNDGKGICFVAPESFSQVTLSLDELEKCLL